MLTRRSLLASAAATARSGMHGLVRDPDQGRRQVLKASCSIATSEGGSPSKEITGAILGRLSENKKTSFLASISRQSSRISPASARSF